MTGEAGTSSRLEFAALAAALGPISTEWGRTTPNQWRRGEVATNERAGMATEYSPARSVAIRLGIAPRVAHRYATEGIPRQSVDRLLGPLGIHPAEVWGDDYWADVLHTSSTPESTALPTIDSPSGHATVTR